MTRRQVATHLRAGSALFGALSLIGLLGCASPERTATNFCRQLALEMPGIAEQPATPEMIKSTVEHYKNLQKVAPLQVEADWDALTLLMEKASKIKASDPASVQEVVDLSYASEKCCSGIQLGARNMWSRHLDRITSRVVLGGT